MNLKFFGMCYVAIVMHFYKISKGMLISHGIMMMLKGNVLLFSSVKGS